MPFFQEVVKGTGAEMTAPRRCPRMAGTAATTPESCRELRFRTAFVEEVTQEFFCQFLASEFESTSLQSLFGGGHTVFSNVGSLVNDVFQLLHVLLTTG